MTRAEWKRWYRQHRIIRRESMKAMVDCMVFGTGAVRHGLDVPEGIQHVPIERIHADAPGFHVFHEPPRITPGYGRSPSSAALDDAKTMQRREAKYLRRAQAAST